MYPKLQCKHPISISPTSVKWHGDNDDDNEKDGDNDDDNSNDDQVGTTSLSDIHFRHWMLRIQHTT